MKEKLEQSIAAVCQELFGVEIKTDLTRPEEQFGDYATNVAMQLAGKLGKNPREIAQTLADAIQEKMPETVAAISVAGPGFLNLTLDDSALLAMLGTRPAQSQAGKSIVAEYSDPNPFKMLHAGHVYTTVVGDAIANLLEVAGGTVHRVNYGGDVGLHVGKTMWAILQRLGGENPDNLQSVPESERSAWLAVAYVEGNNIYETNEQAKTEIVALNKRVYVLHNENDHDSPFAQIYWTCRQWSYEAFDAFYAQLGTKLEKYYPESEVAQTGLELVKEQVGKVFTESDGAVVFKGEDYGLHTRVFINREGLPTYEAKEVGLFSRKRDDYNFDRSVIVTANEQEQYMAVVVKALEQFMPEIAAKATHVNHGMVKLAGGTKMSSRKGNIIPATEVLDATTEAITKTGRAAEQANVLGAIKYAFLKSRLGGDLIYEPQESVSLEGNSGPYLQYAHARACSILHKAGSEGALVENADLQSGERSLVRKVGEFSEVVDKAVNELMPHLICTYLYELAQTFNRFYENNRVIGDGRQEMRLALVEQYANTLKDGLELLGISAPDKM